jgi:phosphoglycolate phosphatase
MQAVATIPYAEAKKYRLAIFDFDGTLADSFPFFVSVFNLLAEQHGFKGIDTAQVDRFRHYSVRRMMEHVGLPAWKLPMVARSFTGMMKRDAAGIALFDGIDAALRRLADSGISLAIVSSNSHENIRQILGPGLAGLISQFECGMSVFGKTSRIKKVLKNSGVPTDAALYIGDQATDLEAARKAGVAFGAVHWGYGAIESLRLLSPEEEFGHVSDLNIIAGHFTT